MFPAVRHHRAAAFSLVEMLAATAILAVLMLIIFSVIHATSRAWKNSTGRIEAFQNARATFESITRRVSQSTLNTYYDYFDHNRNPASSPSYAGPDIYGRQSELHFVSGKALATGQITHSIFFQAPFGYTDDAATFGDMPKLLNACGYYLTYEKDQSRPMFLDSFVNPPAPEYRYRLMEYVQPTQTMNLYTATAFTPVENSYAWIRGGLDKTSASRLLAQNIVALIILPGRAPQDEEKAASQGLPPLAPDYEYSSRATWTGGAQPVKMNQLPPLVRVVMVAIDEASALKLGNAPVAPDLGQSKLFQKADQLDTDLQKFEAVLQARPGNIAGNTIPLSYRIFQTEAPIRGAKWSE